MVMSVYDLPKSKVIFCGPPVGKTCLMRTLCGEDFQLFPKTIGVEFSVFSDSNTFLQIWDTSAQEAFLSITKSIL